MANEVMGTVAVYPPGAREPIVLTITVCGMCNSPVVRDIDAPNGRAGIWPCTPCHERVERVCSFPVDG